MKVYIAGKISGDPDYLDKFQRAALKIRTEGHKVVSPTASSGKTICTSVMPSSMSVMQFTFSLTGKTLVVPGISTGMRFTPERLSATNDCLEVLRYE